MESRNDAELVALTREGNVQAYNDLAQRWDGSVYRFARRILGNDEDARDVCQEALTKAYLNIGRLRDPAKFKSWVHHIALNLCRDRHRSRKAKPEALGYDESDAESIPVPVPAGADAVGDHAARRVVLGGLVERALARLPDEQRTAILLREYQGFTSEEVGEITGVPAATVRTRIFYGLRAVRKSMREQGVSGLDV